ncbi:MAG TPA: hypothetical protein VKV57_14210 [bacterium]|nr:hypothetical protein [bacterium]
MQTQRTHAGSSLAIAAAMALTVSLSGAPAAAATMVWVPAGTPIGLQFVTGVDSRKTTAGNRVHFKVTGNVIVNRHVILRAGAPASGTVTQVGKPGVFGKSAKVVVGFISATGVDGKPIKLTDVVVSKDMINKSRAGAAGATVAGAIVLGPVGLLAGALVRGNDVEVPAGTFVTDTTKVGANVKAS